MFKMGTLTESKYLYIWKNNLKLLDVGYNYQVWYNKQLNLFWNVLNNSIASYVSKKTKLKEQNLHRIPLTRSTVDANFF